MAGMACGLLSHTMVRIVYTSTWYVEMARGTGSAVHPNANAAPV